MSNIKFSHKYNKMQDIVNDKDKVLLLQSIKINFEELTEEFIEYDTSYKEIYYPLPKTELILLLFKPKGKGKLFTTLRRYTPSKYEFYKSSQGKWFDVVIDDKKET